MCNHRYSEIEETLWENGRVEGRQTWVECDVCGEMAPRGVKLIQGSWRGNDTPLENLVD